MDEDRRKENSASTDSAERKKRSVLSICLEILIYVVVAAVVMTTVPRYLLSRVSVDGASMQNTLHDGDQLLAERVSVRTGKIDRFDIIFFHPHGVEDDDIFIKRVIGMPGERVRIDEGIIYINDAPISESFGAEEIEHPGLASETIFLGEDEYFVMGDNRNNSTDSRSPSVGNVKLQNIEGVVLFRIWPLSRFGSLD